MYTGIWQSIYIRPIDNAATVNKLRWTNIDTTFCCGTTL